jgi:hypothetical protein
MGHNDLAQRKLPRAAQTSESNKMFRSLCLGLVCVVFWRPPIAQAADYTKPKVRAITAFVRLTPTTYVNQISDALLVARRRDRTPFAGRYLFNTTLHAVP